MVAGNALDIGGTVWLGIVLFAATNIDDIFILLGFLADRRMRPVHVVVGQYVGIGILIALSGIGAFAALLIPAAYVGLMGLLPIAIGLKQLLSRSDDEDPATRRAGLGTVASVAAVTIANGGDNVAVYVPVFATRTVFECLVLVAVFAAMIAVWLAGAYWLVTHPTLGAPVRRYGRMVTPFVLIALGVWIIVEANL